MPPLATGPGDPTDVLSNLPPGTSPVIAGTVAVAVAVATVAPIVARLLPDRAARDQPALDPSDAADIQGSLARLERDLHDAKQQLQAAQERYVAEQSRAHGLEMELLAAHNNLTRCGDELARVRAQLDVLMRPRLHDESWRVPPRRPPHRAPPMAPADDATTDPIPGAHHAH